MHVNPCPFSTIIILTIRLELYNRIIILKHDSHKKRAFNVKAENFIAKLLFFHFKKKIMRIAYKRKLIYPVTIQVLKKKSCKFISQKLSRSYYLSFHNLLLSNIDPRQSIIIN